MISTSANLSKRYQQAKIWQAIFLFTVVFGIIALAALLLSVINQSAGLVVIQNKVDPASISSQQLESLSSAELISILKQHLTANRFKTIERVKATAVRSQAELVQLVIDEIVVPKVVSSYTLSESLLQRNKIIAEAAAKYPDSTVTFRFWLNWDFLRNSMASAPERAGIRTALFGSLALILITILVAFPIGLGAAIYLSEYVQPDNWFQRVIQTNIDNLAGVPSIIYGILGLAIFVRELQPLTSGQIFGISSGNGRTILSAGLTMALLILPVLIINAQEAIRAVPDSLRQASYGLGATQWQTIWHHVLPAAMPGILTGTILAISRAMGETAPLILVGAATFITKDPSSPFSNFTALPIQIYNWTTRPQEQFRNAAAAAILVLLISLLTINSIAILFRNRTSRKLS